LFVSLRSLLFGHTWLVYLFAFRSRLVCDYCIILLHFIVLICRLYSLVLKNCCVVWVTLISHFIVTTEL
jgi:hypothetical protein